MSKEQEDLDRAILRSIIEMFLKDPSLKDSSLKSVSSSNVTRVKEKLIQIRCIGR
jgi:hypothetical protein